MPGLCWCLLLSQGGQTLKCHLQEPHLSLPGTAQHPHRSDFKFGKLVKILHTWFVKPAYFMLLENQEQTNKSLLTQCLSLWKNHPEM